MQKIEIAIIAIVILVILFVGAKKLPELARGIGQSANELKKGFKGEESPSEKPEQKNQ
jgi:sec-independent protein translocase protein TatA